MRYTKRLLNVLAICLFFPTIVSARFDTVQKSVVQIVAQHPEFSTPAKGTGWVHDITDEYLYILTCNHVVSNLPPHTTLIVMGHYKYPRYYVGATVLWRNTEKDLAMIKVKYRQEDRNFFAKMKIADKKVNLEDHLMIYGYEAKGSYPTAIFGQVRHVGVRNGNDKHTVMFYPRGESGQSGSMVLNEMGQVVGIFSAITFENALIFLFDKDDLKEKKGPAIKLILPSPSVPKNGTHPLNERPDLTLPRPG